VPLPDPQDVANTVENLFPHNTTQRPGPAFDWCVFEVCGVQGRNLYPHNVRVGKVNAGRLAFFLNQFKKKNVNGQVQDIIKWFWNRPGLLEQVREALHEEYKKRPRAPTQRPRPPRKRPRCGGSRASSSWEPNPMAMFDKDQYASDSDNDDSGDTDGTGVGEENDTGMLTSDDSIPDGWKDELEWSLVDGRSPEGEESEGDKEAGDSVVERDGE
jgi:hypothetical protein